jgi:hypothetical protein
MTILTPDRLEREHLLALLDRHAAVVRVRDWIPLEDAARLSDAMLDASGIRTRHLGMDVDGSKWATDHDRVGPSFTSLYRDWVSAGDRQRDVLEAYAQAGAGTRALFAKAVDSSPIDRLFERAASCWPDGALPAQLDGTSIFYGSGRIWGGLPALPNPHVDSIHPALYRFDGQLSAVAYLRTPDAGGELELWDVDEGEFTQKVIEKKVTRADLPAPVRITPRAGELILFNARKPHMVAQVTAGWRVVQQCFIGLSRDRPLTFWT